MAGRPSPEDVLARQEAVKPLSSRLYPKRTGPPSLRPALPRKPDVITPQRNNVSMLGFQNNQRQQYLDSRKQHFHGGILDECKKQEPHKPVYSLAPATKKRPARKRTADAKPAGEVSVPTSLQSLLGPSLQLRPAPDANVTFSKSSRLPSSRDALLALRRKQGLGPLQPSRPLAPKPNQLAPLDGELTEHKEQTEDKNDLQSPFSFIDKIIQNPYSDEFVYLNPRGAYDLRIVKHDEIMPDNYYTMSRAGVTHFYMCDTEFTSLDQWEREYFLYTKMMQIPFFRQFRMWKAFYSWKKTIRKNKLQKCSKYLTENLYILNPYLGKSLVQLRKLCHDASKWVLFKVDPYNTRTLDEFKSAQLAQKQVVIEDLAAMSEQVRQIVLNACQVDLREFLVQNGFRKGTEEHGTDDAYRDEDYTKISHAEKAAIRTKCRKLTKYIRLADYFVIDTLVTLSMERTTDVLNFVERTPSATSPAPIERTASSVAVLTGKPEKEKDAALFSVELVMTEDFELAFEPPMEAFQETLEMSIDSAVRAVMSPNRLVHDPEFEQYTQATFEEEHELQPEAMVLREPNFLRITHGIKHGMTRAFAQAAAYAESFERYKTVFVENEATDMQEFAGKEISVLSSVIEKYVAQREDVDAMAVIADIGIVRVDSERIKAQITPSPQRCLDEIGQLLPRVATDKCTSLLEETKEANQKISCIPATVDEFVEVMSFLNEIQEQQEASSERMEFNQQLYSLMTDNNIRVPEAYRKDFEKLTRARSEFKTALLLSETAINQNMERFIQELEDMIPMLVSDVTDIAEQLCFPMVEQVESDVEEVIGFLEDRNQAFTELEQKAKKFQEYQAVLQVEVREYDNIVEVRADLDTKMGLWGSLKRWDEFMAQYKDADYRKVDVEELKQHMNVFNKEYARSKRQLPENPVVPYFKEKIVAFQNVLPVVVDLRNPNLKRHHWEEIKELLQYDIKNSPEVSIGTLIELDAVKHKMDIGNISNKAAQEAALEEMLEEVVLTWSDLNFPVNQHKVKDVYILGNLDDVIAALDETMVTVNTIMGSSYVEPIREQVQEWSHKLSLFQETLEEWMDLQRKWMYLEPIFTSQDIIRQLPEMSAAFSGVDKGWKEAMRRTNDQPNAMNAGTYPGLRDNFTSYNAILDKVMKQLESYLETRRQLFPRFYFLSSDELLRIISQSKSVEAVQPHLRQCFDNIVRLEFADKDIRAMFSSEGERVPLGKNLKARGAVEVWLSSLETDMVKSLRRQMKRGVVDYERTPRRIWVLEKIAQVVMTVSQIAWARGCEQAITSDNPKKALVNWYDMQMQQLADLTMLVRGELSSIDRRKIVALVTTDVHGRDVVGTIRDSGVANIRDFTWQQQLRFYWDAEEDDCLVRQANATFNYGYEYMGVTSRLVITPLTDRCWMTITGALHICYGAAPAGPAGTGKTESTKDLAKALGFLCIVMNCSEQLRVADMGKLFSGCAQAGAWTCLDEFNRIDIEVLSVIAQQLLQVRQGLLAKAADFNFQSQQIPLKKDFGVMITMNPGYAGRTELPDNLKVLFRPVSMMIPDYALIAEIMLYAEGFDQASTLSRKMVKLYKLSSEQLSQQDHYDFGMRAVKSVLVMAGTLKRAEPDMSENVVLVRAMRDANVPKFLSEDLPLFYAIMRDLFPGVEIPTTDYSEINGAMDVVLEEMGLQKVDKFKNKVTQLFETFNVRFGVMIVGPTCGGKSTCHKVLARTATKLRKEDSLDDRYQVVHEHILNPKCISMGELYGEVDAMTQEWTDGLASTIMREAIQDTGPDNHWVVFDGPVDALWIENMNTVLDDNMTLCLANGERIKLKHEMRMLFEVQDLAVASPATVSRCGMVYMTPADLGYLPYVRSWLPSLGDGKLNEELREHLYTLFEAKVADALKFIRQNCHSPIPTVENAMVVAQCQVFSSIFNEKAGVDFNEDTQALVPLVELCFAYSFAWGLGGSLDEPSQIKFGKYLSEVLVNTRPMGPFFDSYVDVPSKSWKSWNDVVPDFVYDSSKSYFTMLVPTIDTVRYASIMEKLLDIERPVFFTGVSGVGKSVIASERLKQLRESGGVEPVFITFSAQSSSRKTQEAIEAKMTKIKRTLLGPPVNKALVIFIDDVNMPALEEYGAQPPVELLRQFVDLHGLYDHDTLAWRDVIHTTLACAAAPPGGGRNPLTPRFVSHFNVLCLPTPTADTMVKIFSSIMTGFLSEGFKKEVAKLGVGVVEATVELFETLTKELLPTPAKSHYTFNLRDVSKVCQGILMIKPQFCKEPEILTRLWAHECCRCFHDRLINTEDKSWFTNKVVSLMPKHMSISWSHQEVFEDNPLMFGDFMAPGGEKNYMNNAKKVSLSRLFEDYLEEFNMNAGSQMHLVFFDDAIQHISRILRILRQPRGNALLVGLGGSGRQSLTRLASFVAEMPCMEIALTRGFGYTEFQEHLKKVMHVAGVEAKHVVFLLSENAIVEERFLEDVNNLLNTAEVPNLYNADDQMTLLEEMTPIVKEMGMNATRASVQEAFTQRVRDHLHIVLCLSPAGSSFRVRCRMFPSLINCTTIDWFDKWPRQALLSVARSYTSEMDMSSDEAREALASLCVEVHVSMEDACDKFENELRRKVYTTPKSYLDLIALLLSLMAQKRDELNERRDHLMKGLKKLEETTAVVSDLQETLEKLAPTLVVKAQQAEELLAKVTVDSEAAAKVQASVEIEAKAVNKQATEVGEAQADAQADLDIAMPALEKALKQLGKLKSSEISEMKVMQKPPKGVVLTMEAICILFNEPTTWDASKKLLGNSKFLSMVQSYDKDNMDPKIIKKVQKYIINPEVSEERMASVSRPAASLMLFVRAMVIYDKVAKEVGPKKERVAALNLELEKANAILKEKMDALNAIQAKVAALKAQCDETVAEKAALDFKSKQTEQRLSRAEKLTSGLGGEAVRWEADSKRITEELQNLVGSVFLGAAAVSYLGPFTGEYRQSLMDEWLALVKESVLPTSDEFSLAAVLGSPIEIRQWNIHGLPTDSVSVESGIIAMRAKRWPLMIDPQQQAHKWIKNQFKNRIEVVRFTSSDLLKTLEQSIRMGHTVLIEEVGEGLEPAIDPILLHQTYEKNGRMYLRLGEKEVDYNENFQLFLTTKLANPHYMPEICIKVTLLNFTVTKKGLEDQLLGEVVSKERADVEEKKNKLVVSLAADRKQLSDIEAKILRMLSESKGKILDDEDLVETLDSSKFTSKVIEERVQESTVIQADITEIREGYRPVAQRGSILFFVISDLASIDPMYQFSLASFMRLFKIAMDNAEPALELQQRLDNLMSYMTKSIFVNVSRGLFVSHKLLFSFLICCQIHLASGDIREAEWNVLLRGARVKVTPPANPLPELLSETVWTGICALEKAIHFDGLVDDFSLNTEDWREYLMDKNPHKRKFPGNWDDTCEPFQRLLLLKALRQEKVIFAIADYVEIKMGKEFVAQQQTSMDSVYADTDIATPAVFILSAGADPTSMLLRFAKEQNYSDKLNIISLGQGQGPNAKKLIDSAQKTGDWVLLQNCHLAKSWMPDMEALIEGFEENEANINPKFRLWLTSMPCSYFPVSVLQNGVKLTNEPPKGLRANLNRSFVSILDPEYFETCTKPEPWKKLSFGLCFFHAMIQERKKFGSLGWNKAYDFNDSDLETALQVTRMFLEEQELIPWDSLLYVCGQINFGGRVTDDWDRRCLMSILSTFLNPEILKDEYRFSTSGMYYAPTHGEHQTYVDYLNTLPSADDPEIFGMHENANLTFQQQETSNMLDTVLSIQPREVSSGAGLSPDELVANMAAEMEESLPALLDKEKAGPGVLSIDETSGVLSSLSVVLLQEMDRFNNLLKVMRKTLEMLQQAIRGEVVMTLELDGMYSAFMINRVPTLWSKVGYLSLKPLASWIKDCHARVEFMRSWLENGHPNSYWLSGFFFPQGFMTGVLQKHARKYTVPIDGLNFAFSVQDAYTRDEVEEPPEDGVYVDGLFLDGARWDPEAKAIDDSKLGELFSSMPVIHFVPAENYKPDPTEYQCPAYKTSERTGILSTTGQSTNFILPVGLPCTRDPAHWVLKGAALLTQLDE